MGGEHLDTFLRCVCRYIHATFVNKRDGVFYKEFGAEEGTQNPKFGALATYTDRLGSFLIWRQHIKLAFATLGPPKPSSPLPPSR